MAECSFHNVSKLNKKRKTNRLGRTIIICWLWKQDVLTIKRWGDLVSSDCPTIAKAQKVGWSTQYIYFSSSWRCHSFIYQCHMGFWPKSKRNLHIQKCLSWVGFLNVKIHFLKNFETCLMPDEIKYLVVLHSCPLKTATIIPKLPLFSHAGRWNVHVHEHYVLQSAASLWVVTHMTNGPVRISVDLNSSPSSGLV